MSCLIICYIYYLYIPSLFLYSLNIVQNTNHNEASTLVRELRNYHIHLYLDTCRVNEVNHITYTKHYISTHTARYIYP